MINSLTEVDDAVRVHRRFSDTVARDRGVGFSARVGGSCELCGAYQITSRIRMEFDAVIMVLKWLPGSSVTMVWITTDSKSIVKNVQNGWLCHELLPCIT